MKIDNDPAIGTIVTVAMGGTIYFQGEYAGRGDDGRHRVKRGDGFRSGTLIRSSVIAAQTDLDPIIA